MRSLRSVLLAFSGQIVIVPKGSKEPVPLDTAIKSEEQVIH